MIDFEEDVPVTDAQRLQKQVQEIGSGVKEALDTASKGRLLKAGLQVGCSAIPCTLQNNAISLVHSHRLEHDLLQTIALTLHLSSAVNRQ